MAKRKEIAPKPERSGSAALLPGSAKCARKIASRAGRWQGRIAHRLSNGVLELIALSGGGHVASLRFAKSIGHAGTNVLWQAPWRTYEPGALSARQLNKRFGSVTSGQYLASATGHALCLDYFGPPSQSAEALGLPLHGEAASRNWERKSCSCRRSTPTATWAAELPAAGLSFQRTIALLPGQSVAVFRETVQNRRSAARDLHWVQHVTFGPPFATKLDSRFFLSGRRGRTWPHGYERKSLLRSDAKFLWPRAPREGGGQANLAVPFAKKGTGYVASVLLKDSRKLGYIAVLNWRLGIVAGYLFRPRDFPWVAVWEENCCRSALPWSGRAQVRGMEFGTTPMPVGREEMFARGKVFGKKGWTRIAGKRSRSTTYLAFLARVPKDWRSIRDITLLNEEIVVSGPQRGKYVRLGACVPENKKA
jgi:hypothetical protein